MSNRLNEKTGSVNKQGRDINVLDDTLPVDIGFGSVLFEIALWLIGFVPAALFFQLADKALENYYLIGGGLGAAGFLPGLIFLFMKTNAGNYFEQLEQVIQTSASEIDNYLEQRVQILQNVVGLVGKAIELDKGVMETVAAYRSGVYSGGAAGRNEAAARIDSACARLFPNIENYPDLKAHAAIADAMQQNSYLQKEITAARTAYNNVVRRWNTDIFSWPTKRIVAARAGLTTRIPFTASEETKAQARAKFF